MNDEKDGFRVVDKRRFDETGDKRDDIEDVKQEAAAPEPAPAPASEPTEESNAAPGGMPPIDFPQFVLSLATSAQLAMGLIEHPQAKNMPQDLNAARQTIDIIAMLKEKTVGNLSDDEAKLIEEIVHTLHLQYLNVAKKAQ